MTTQPEPTDPVPDPLAAPVPEPAEDLVAPEHIREADRGDGPEADLVATDAEVDRTGRPDGPDAERRTPQTGPVDGS